MINIQDYFATLGGGDGGVVGTGNGADPCIGGNGHCGGVGGSGGIPFGGVGVLFK